MAFDDLGYQANNQGSMIVHQQKSHQTNYNQYEEEDESYDDEDGEYEDDIEEGVPCESDYDANEYAAQQQRNNRYGYPQAVLETVEQESDEYRSSICDSTNYVSQPKMFAKDKQVSKPPSMRYFSQKSGGNN